jgi:IclR family acetate operon transcriptional repressor
MARLPTNSLDRALVVLQFIAQTPGGLTNLEISRAFRNARSTCSYILSRLEREGYRARDKESGKYRIWLKTVIFGRSALREVGFRSAGEPTLYRLAADTGLTANLAVLEGDHVIILDRVEGPAFIGSIKSSKVRESIQMDGEWVIGSEVPALTTAVGKILLAYLPKQQLAKFLARSPLVKKGTRKNVAAQDLLAELAKLCQQEFCMMRFGSRDQYCAIAAPIFDASETVRATVSVSRNRDLTIWKDVNALSEIVKEAAWEISRRLHYPKLIPRLKDHSTSRSSARTKNYARQVSS